MRSVLLAFSDPESAAKIKNILARAALPVGRVCANGATLLQQAMLFDEGGVVIIPSRLPDISVPDLYSRLPETFDILVLQDSLQRQDYTHLLGLTTLKLPLSGTVLTETVANLLEYRVPTVKSQKYGERANPWLLPVNKRTGSEARIISDAKLRLMNEQYLTEDQAHRTLQRMSMETGINLAETARLLLEK